MGDSNANSYDLLQARQLLSDLTYNQRLAAKKQHVELETSPYTSLSKVVFSKSPTSATPQVEPAERVTPELKIDVPSKPFQSWEDCIAWSMTLTRAEAAFVVDSQGFVIACRGMVPSQGYEGAGAELICSIDQLERIAPDAGRLSCVDLDFDKKRLVGFVATTDDSPLFIVGIVEPEILTDHAKSVILRQIISNLPNMD